MREAGGELGSSERYGALRLKLVFYFERRNCNCPEDLADECLYRVFLYQKKHELPTTLERFTFGFAPNVYHEWLRDTSRFAQPAEDVADWVSAPTGDLSPAGDFSRIVAEISVSQMDPLDRELMEQYYLDGRSADSLAAEWGLSAEGIRSRIFRKRRLLMNAILAQKGATGETNRASGSIHG